MRMIGPGVARQSGRSLKLRNHLRNGKRLFIRNNTTPRNIIFLSWIAEGSKDRSSEIIANTYLPIEITKFISPDNLLRSEDFWTYIEAGALVPVSLKDAMAELSTSDADEERARLKAASGGSAVKGVGRTVSVQPMNGYVGTLPIDTRPQNDDGDSRMSEPKLTPSIVAISGRINMSARDGGMPVGLALAELKNTPALTREDLAFLVSNGTVVNESGVATDTRISDWAMAQMTKLNSRNSVKPKKKSGKGRKNQKPEKPEKNVTTKTKSVKKTKKSPTSPKADIGPAITP